MQGNHTAAQRRGRHQRQPSCAGQAARVKGRAAAGNTGVHEEPVLVDQVQLVQRGRQLAAAKQHAVRGRVLELLHARAEAERVRVAEALELLDVTELADRPVHQLSYGQRKRVAIAGAVAMRPQVLLLDEPTAGLDPRAVTTLRAALSNLEARGTTVVVSTHDIDFAWEWADEVGVVVDGIVHQGSTVKIMTDEALLGRAHLGVPWPVRLLRSLGHEIDVVADTIEKFFAA